MNQCPIGTFYYTNCPYARSLLIDQNYVYAPPLMAQLTPELNQNYSCPKCENNNADSQSLSKFSLSEINLINTLRMLWEQHTAWTRATIISIAFNLPDVDLVIKRLLRNPSDFGNALSNFYCIDIANKFSDLLNDHVVIGVELVKASKSGKKQAASKAEKRWSDNADEIAAFLSKINPYWTEEKMKEMFHQHLALVKSATVSVLTKKFENSITEYDEIENQALEMADMMSEGLINQFQNIFTE